MTSSMMAGGNNTEKRRDADGDEVPSWTKDQLQPPPPPAQQQKQSRFSAPPPLRGFVRASGSSDSDSATKKGRWDA